MTAYQTDHTGLETLAHVLPSRLLQRLQQLAQTYRQAGVELFVFGSFARGDQRPTSDLDLGGEWASERDPQTFTRLYWDVQQLPTIRKIELVDFTQVGPRFKRVAVTDRIYLSEEKSRPDEESGARKRL